MKSQKGLWTVAVALSSTQSRRRPTRPTPGRSAPRVESPFPSAVPGARVTVLRALRDSALHPGRISRSGPARTHRTPESRPRGQSKRNCDLYGAVLTPGDPRRKGCWLRVPRLHEGPSPNRRRRSGSRPGSGPRTSLDEGPSPEETATLRHPLAATRRRASMKGRPRTNGDSPQVSRSSTATTGSLDEGPSPKTRRPRDPARRSRADQASMKGCRQRESDGALACPQVAKRPF